MFLGCGGSAPNTWAKSRGASLATQPAHATISVNLFFILPYTQKAYGLRTSILHLTINNPNEY